MKLKLLQKSPAGEKIISFYFKPEEEFEFLPGQFLKYTLPNALPDERGEKRFFSIASAPYEGRIQLTTKFSEKNSTFKKDLANLKIGDSIEASGPMGKFTIEEGKKDYVFIAGGMGITPFRSILLEQDHQKKPLNITLLYGNRTRNALFKDELETLSVRHPEFKIYYNISEEKVAEENISSNVKITPGRLGEDIFKSLIPNLKSSIFYISGPESMVMDLEEILENLGVPKENLHGDYFPGYKSY